MSEGTDDRSLPAEGALSLARLALADGDLSHAAEQIARALAEAPTGPGVHETLAQLAARYPGNPADLYPLDRPVFVGTVVARAHLLAAAGEHEEALDLLAAATAHDPRADWAGVPWVADPQLPARLAPDALARVFTTVCAPLADPLPPAEREPLRPYLTLARHATRAHPDHAYLLGVASALARRVGEPGLALDWARRASQLQPAKATQVWLGYAYRSAGRVRDALAAWQRALAYEPDDLALYVEIADTLADADHLDEALDWIDRALARDRGDTRVVRAAHRLRFRRDEDVAHLVVLVDHARAYPDGEDATSDLAEICRGRPWLGRVPPPGDQVADVVRRVLASPAPRPGGGQLTLHSLAPPSAMNTLSRVVPDLQLRIQQMLPPDIRTPRRAVGLRLWTYQGTTAVAAQPPPAPASAAVLAEVARWSWPHPLAAYERAARLATVPVADLLGALVHPPAPPEHDTDAWRDPVLWVRTVQVWACLGLVHHGAEEPWGPSARRRTLVDLVFGVEDWITEAAMFALVTSAWVDPIARSDVAALVRERLADIAEVAAHRPVSIAWSLARLALLTPELPPEAARLAREIVTVEEADDEETGESTLGRLRRLLSPRRPGG